MKQSTRRLVLRFMPVTAIILVAFLGATWGRGILSFEALRLHRETLILFRDVYFGWTLLVFIGAYVFLVAFSLPGAMVATLTGGFLFGTLVGTMANVLAATIGAVIVFLAVRYGVGGALTRRLDASDGMVGRFKRGIDRNQWSMLFFIRLVPVVPFFVANLIPALLQVPLSRFAFSTLFGIIPGSVVYTSVGAGLGQVFEREEVPDLGVIFEVQVLLPIIGLCILSIVPVIYRYFAVERSS